MVGTCYNEIFDRFTGAMEKEKSPKKKKVKLLIKIQLKHKPEDRVIHSRLLW